MRARGANALMAAAFEAAYGTPEEADYFRLPFVSSNLGEEQGLIESDLLGYGREPLDPSEDVPNNVGDVVVPVDTRAFGYWLKLLMGDPDTAASVAATGSITFSAQPASNSTVTLNGVAFTFVTGSPTGNQVQKGATLADTMTALAAALNGSADPDVDDATYVATATGITITHDTLGPAGNAFPLAASPTANATLSGDTLTDGANTHTFTSGSLTLPSMCIEVGLPEVPNYAMNFGGRGNTLRVAMTRGGLLNATVNVICQGESFATSPVDAELDEVHPERFAQAMGEIKRNGVQLGNVVGAEFTYSNNLDPVPTIRPDGRIEDADPGMVSMMGSITTRFADMTLLDQATNREPCEASFGWSRSPGKSLLVTNHRVFLPKPKRPIEGPGAIQQTMPWQAARALDTGITTTIALTNDVAGY